MTKITSIFFITILVLVMVFSLLIPDEIVSFSERRTLNEFPELSVDSLLDGDYFEDLESYFLDHILLRDKFKSVKVALENNVFRKSDINEMYMQDDHLIKIEYPYNKVMGLNFVDYVETIKEKYLKDNSVYVSIIPDKNYFGDNGRLKMNYEEMIQDIKFGDYIYIELFDTLNLNDFYLTDPHWKQENLDRVLDKLSSNMNFELPLAISDYDINGFENFYGAYVGQSSFDKPAETLNYLTHESMDQILVYDFEIGRNIELYDQQAFKKIDPYELFVGGASPLIELVNEGSILDNELIVFRDSFSSSLVPLLMNSYSKITLIDTRYISHDLLVNYVKFESQDVLFLYSSLVVNNSLMLR